MIFKLEIEMDNAAFVDENGDVSYSAELAKILRSLADNVETHATVDFSANLYDINGNKVGIAEVIED
jgi:hypothetical protein